jgi:hypothetical protein
MDVTTTGRYRVLESPRGEGEYLLVDVTADESDDYDPTYVTTEGYEGALAATVSDLRPGYLVSATLRWTDGEDAHPRFEDLTVERRTRYEFVDGATGIFEAAREAWLEAEANNEPMNSRVTYSTDNVPNGVVYVFAKQSGARDLFEEFRSGIVPIEPLVARVNESRDDDDPREVFVMRPADEPFVLVYIVFSKDGLLADTVRDTYGSPREDEESDAKNAEDEESNAKNAEDEESNAKNAEDEESDAKNAEGDVR